MRFRSVLLSFAALCSLTCALSLNGHALADFPDLELQTVSEGSLVAPVEIVHAGDESGRLFIADQRGKIQIIDTATDTLLATPFLDILAKLVPQRAGFDERGLLGMAFHPDYATATAAGEGKFYLYYSAPSPNAPGTASDPVDHQSVIAEYSVSAGDPDVANILSERILLTFDQPQFNHDGGDLAFGADGFLYISTGDGGSSADNNAGHTGGNSDRPSGVLGNAQDLTNLLGKILRIDPLGTNGPGGQYGIPATNFLVGDGGGVREEIFAYGLRNPWRMSFDDGPNGSGRLFAADVGQGRVEEVNIITSGGNYGWRNKEGTFDFDATAPGSGPFIDPIVQYAHPNTTIGNPELPKIGLSVTGGEVYRGATIPGLHGKYVFADWSTSFGIPNGTMLGAEETAPGVYTLTQLSLTGGNPIPRYITAIGSGENGDLFVATRTVLPPETESGSGDATGVIFRIVAASETVNSNESITVNPEKDNTIFSENGNSNGVGEFLFAGNIAQGGQRRALMKFAMPTLPQGAQYQSASLSLTLSRGAGTNGPFQVHRLTADWGEGTSDAGDPGGTGAAPTTGDATWTRRFHNTISWASVGGDFNATASASTLTNVGTTTWTSPTLTQDVQDWLNGQTNHGWIVRDPGGDQSAKRFFSREHSVAGSRPKLVVNYSITTNVTPVPAPAGLDLTDASDSGVSNSDDFTNDDSPTIEGIAPLGSTVTLFSNGSPVGSQVVNSIPFSITTSPLTDGVSVITATTTEAGGGGRVSDPSDPLTLTIDTALPAVSAPDLAAASDSGSANTDNITNITTPVLSGTGEAGASVEVSSDLDGVIGNATVTGGGTWTITSIALSEGAHTITATATEEAGNQNTSSPLALTIDTTAPPAPTSLDLLASSDDGPSDTDNETTDNTPTINGNAEVGSAVVLSSDVDGAVGIATGAAPFTITTDPLQVAQHNLTAIATDLAGNSSPASDALQIDVIVPIDPNIVVENPAGTALNSGDPRSFGNQPLNSINEMTFTVRNNGLSDLSDFVVTFPIPDLIDNDGDALVDEPGEWADIFSATTPSGPLSPGQSTTFTVSFTPAEARSYSATLHLESNDPNDSPFAIEINGRGNGPRDDKPVDTPPSPAGAPLADPITWEEVAVGTYDGLLLDQVDGESLVGCISKLKVASPKTGSGLGGSVSGTVNFGGRKARIKGSFDLNGALTVNLPQSDGTTVIVNLQLVRTTVGGGAAIRGAIEWDGTTAVADLSRAPYHSRLNPAPEALTGRYTMLMPSTADTGIDEPGGDGFTALTIASSGSVKVSGVLGDGVRFTESACLSADDQFSLYANLYGRSPLGGQIGGTMTLRDEAGVSDFDGTLQWRKMPREKENIYPLGFEFTVAAVGSIFTPPERGERILTQLADQHFNAELSFIGPTAPPPTGGADGVVDRVLSWAANNRLTHFGPEKLSAAANTKTGLISGSFFDPASRTRVPLKGVSYQKQGIAGGNFVNAASSGAIRILPGTDFSFPGSEHAGPLTLADLPGSPATPPVVTDLAAFDPAAAGNFQGVLTASSVVSGGLEKIKLSKTGGISGFVWVEGVRHRFKGIIDLLTGGTVIMVERENLTPITVTLQLGLANGSADGFQLTGTVEADAVTHDIDAQRRPVFSQIDPSPHTGRYTVAMRAADGSDASTEPAGDGYGSINVSVSGAIRALMILADGTRASTAGHFSRNDEFSVHRNLYRGVVGGYLAGKLTARELVGISDMDGELRWVKPNGAKPDMAYPAGFDLARGVVASMHTKPARDERAFDVLDDAFHNAWLRIVGTGSFADIDRAITWDSRNRLTYFGPERVSMRFNSSTGLVTGSYLDQDSGLRIRFGGALIDDQDLVTGFHVTDGESENVTIEPRDPVP